MIKKLTFILLSLSLVLTGCQPWNDKSSQANSNQSIQLQTSWQHSMQDRTDKSKGVNQKKAQSQIGSNSTSSQTQKKEKNNFGYDDKQSDVQDRLPSKQKIKKRQQRQKKKELQQSLEKIQDYTLWEKANLFCEDMYMLTGMDGERLQGVALEQAKKNRKKCKQIKAQARKKKRKTTK